jgi:hypothetical protein
MNAKRLKVLVIDDERPIRKLLRMGLTTKGYEKPPMVRRRWSFWQKTRI